MKGEKQMEFCVSYSAVGADCCIYGACPFWSHMTLRCEYSLYTEDELAMMVALERKKNNHVRQIQKKRTRVA